jgi:DNA-binding beta-propeller fold protein YncE
MKRWLQLNGLLLLVLSLPACVRTQPPAAANAVASHVWPPPPAEPRIAFVQSFCGPKEWGVTYSLWRRFLNLITGSGGVKENLVKPFGVALDEANNICLTDTSTCMVSYFNHVEKSFTRWPGTGAVAFVQPVAVAKAKGIFYVADTGLKKILAFDERGRQKLEITEGLERPSGLVVHGDKLFVADALCHAILIFGLDGKLMARFGGRGSAPGDFNCPTHITTDAQGRLYVTDAMNSRVQVFTQAGRLLSVIGGAGDTPGHFGRPKGVAVDAFGHVYVADALFDNIQVFDLSGRLLMVWGETGEDVGEFWLPEGLAIGRGNEIFVADSYNQRVQVFKYVGAP